MIQEVIVVEGKRDVAAVRRAVDADCIMTGGFSLPTAVLRRIGQAQAKRGIIILTDPDHAGEKIRKRLIEAFPEAKHAFIPRADAQAEGDIGVERAKPEAIRKALEQVRYHIYTPSAIFTTGHLLQAGLIGETAAAERRGQLGELLGIGYANAKQFLYRLNHYGVTEQEFWSAVAARKEEGQDATDHCT